MQLPRYFFILNSKATVLRQNYLFSLERKNNKSSQSPDEPDNSFILNPENLSQFANNVFIGDP